MTGTIHTELIERVKAVLRRSRIGDLRRLTVERGRGAVVLRGHVSSFYHKQLAQELVRNELDDGVEVVNQAHVVDWAESR
jgi:osmotically-inducible protein OsmY